MKTDCPPYAGCPAPFLDLLEYLRTHGFSIGVESHLRLRVLLDQLGDSYAPADLKTILCPLFATNAGQQELFYRAFDSYYPFLAEPGPEPLPAVEGLAACGARDVKPKDSVRRWPYLLAGALLLILSVSVLTWKTSGVRRRTQAPDPAATPPDISGQTAPAPRPVASPQSSSLPLQEKSIDVRWLPPSFSPWLARYSDRRIALGWTAVLAPFVFWLLHEVYQSRRRQFRIAKHRGKAPPYSWPIQAEQRHSSIYDAQQVAAVSQLLHRRQQAESERLDVESTVFASIATLGFPAFRYRKDSRLPEYLFLIDRRNFRDHEACLFDNLAGVLHEQGLFVSAYFYEGDPRICWDKLGAESIHLEQLQRSFPGHRLLIFGDGDQFLDPVTGRLSQWHRLLSGWQDRALLTPRPAAEWGLPEYTLATQFLVAPATLGGLNAVAAYFAMPASVEPDSGSLTEEAVDRRDEHDIERSLRRSLGHGTFQWLCACAIYPELHWDLTLRLGSLPSLPPGLVQEEKIVRLLRLPWFRTGSMPDELRRTLVAQLDPALQREARECIVHLIENHRAPAGTYAADAFQFQIAYQRYWSDPRDREARRRLREALTNLSPDQLVQDYAYLEAAESANRSPLHILLPERLRKVLYSAVGPSLGLRSAVRGFAVVAMVIALLQTLRMIDGKAAAATQRYRELMSRGRGLSLSQSNGSVRIGWSPSSFAVQQAVRGQLSIQDGVASKSYSLDLGKDQLEAGEAEFKPSSSPVRIALLLFDERGNRVEQTARIEIPRGTAIQQAQAQQPPPAQAKQPPPVPVQILGKVFQAPASRTTPIPQAPTLEQPDIDVRSEGVVDRLLTSSGVLPPPPITAPQGKEDPPGFVLGPGRARPLRAGAEMPVGLVLAPGGARLLRKGVQTALAAKAGDILFQGDALRTESGATTFSFCPAKVIGTLGPTGEVRFESNRLRTQSGVLSQRNITVCSLPYVVRVAVASQQHYGVTMTRGLKDEPKPTPPERWPAGVAAEIAAFDKAIAVDPRDPGALVGRASVFEKYNLLANALADYKNIGEQWKDPVWVKGKIFELSATLTDREATTVGANHLPGKTYALLIGISQFARLPQEQWLRYAARDAEAMAQALRTPRLGALPDENIVLLTDVKATTAAIRNGLQTFLKGPVTRNDTVIILIVGHGAVEFGSKNAYIFTHDSDPQDLASTAMPIDEVQTLIDDGLRRIGRVAVFVDVCRAGNTGSIKNTTVNSVVEKLGEAEGEILGLMASRPKELSYEGPGFGGGHGAFTYFLIKGLMGAADVNSDGSVEAYELIEYIRSEVPKATGDKQHPREFGNMDNHVVFSDTTKPGITLQ